MDIAENKAEVVAIVLGIKTVEAEVERRVLAVPEAADVWDLGALGGVGEEDWGVFGVDLDGGGVAEIC